MAKSLVGNSGIGAAIGYDGDFDDGDDKAVDTDFGRGYGIGHDNDTAIGNAMAKTLAVLVFLVLT